MKYTRKSYNINLGLLLLRVLIGGFMLLQHGLPKLASFSKSFHSFSDPLGVGSEISYLLAVFAEFVCSILVMIGLFTRFAVIPLIITMLVAAFIIHGDDPFSKKEFALIYAIPFIALFFTGAGDYSIDNRLANR